MTNSYALATSTWDEKELESIQSVIDKDMFTMGESVAAFEKDFCKFVDSKYAVMVSSGSTANLIATAALFYTKNPKLKRGDEVIVPAVSWSTTYFPLQQYGLKLKFVDIDLDTLNYDLKALESAITENTKMIMVVNLLGNPNDFDKIFEMTKEKDIIVLEDNCESMGAEYKGKQTGTFGIMGTYSTFFSHHMATMEGGFVVTDDEELYHILLSMRAHGWTRNLPKENKVCTKSDDWFEESFRFVLPGYNVRPVEMSGAIGIEQLKKLPSFLSQRRKNAKFFIELFKDHKNFMIQKDVDNSSWFGFSLIIKPTSKLKRKDVIKKLQDAKIDCRPIVTGNFTRNEVMNFFDYEIHQNLKNADYLHDNGFFVGNSQVCLENGAKIFSGEIKMKVVLLAGGFGTRLSEETDLRPKPMVEIGGKPILWHIMKSYSEYGYNDFVILLGYKGYFIKEYFANYFLHQSDVTIDLKNNNMEIHNNFSEPWKVTLLDTGLDTMTGGRIKRAKDFIGNEPFMLTYGDGVSDINIKELVEFHKSHNGCITMTSSQPAGRFGALNLDADNKITKFLEKPKGDGSWINAGFFVCDSEVLDYIDNDDNVIFEQEPLKNLANDHKMYTYKHHGFWKPMDSLKDKNDLIKMWNTNQAPWKVW